MSDTRYTDEVQRVFKTMKPPFPGFIVDIVDRMDYLELRVYRPVIEMYSDPQKMQLAEYLYALRDAIKQCTIGGEPIKCHIQGVEHAPPNWRRR